MTVTQQISCSLAGLGLGEVPEPSPYSNYLDVPLVWERGQATLHDLQQIATFVSCIDQVNPSPDGSAIIVKVFTARAKGSAAKRSYAIARVGLYLEAVYAAAGRKQFSKRGSTRAYDRDRPRMARLEQR